VECGEQTTEIDNGNWTSCTHIITKSADEVIKEEGERQKIIIRQRKKCNIQRNDLEHCTRNPVAKYKELRRQGYSTKVLHKMKKKLFHEETMKEI
jgi:hypothetical protein